MAYVISRQMGTTEFMTNNLLPSLSEFLFPVIDHVHDNGKIVNVFSNQLPYVYGDAW